MEVYTTTPPAEGFVKFICVKGEYRFINTDMGMGPAHKDALKLGEIAESAGTIGINVDHWKVYDLGSMSLKIGMRAEDYERLTALLGKPYKDRY